MNKSEKIKILLQCTHNMSALEEGFKSLLNAMPNHGIPELENIKIKFLSKFAELFENSLKEQATLFDANLSEEAIDAAITFFSSEAGQEIIKAMPAINEHLMSLSSTLSATLTKELITDILELDLSDEEMTAMGFHKIDPRDFADMFPGVIKNLENELGMPVDFVNEDEEEEKVKPKPMKDECLTLDKVEDFMDKWVNSSDSE